MKFSKKKTAVISAAVLVLGLQAYAGAEVLKEVNFADYAAIADADGNQVITASELNALTDANGKNIVSITEGAADVTTYAFEQDGADASKTWLTVTTASNVEAGMTKLVFPFIEANGFELNDYERLVVEYELKVNSPVFEQRQIGSAGLLPGVIRKGGNNGYVQYNMFFKTSDSRNRGVDYYKTGDDGLITEYAMGPELKITMDMDSGAGQGTSKIVNLEGKSFLNTTRDISDRSLTDLEFNVAGVVNGVQPGSISIANIKIYTVPKFTLVSTDPEDGAEGVYPTKRTIKAVFTNAVDAESLKDIRVYLNGSHTKDGFTIALDETDAENKTVLITFESDLEYSTTYKVDYSAMTDTDNAQTVSGDAEIEFRTEEVEELVITGFRAIQGTDSSAVAGNSFYKGKLNGAEITVSNNSAEDSSICVILAVYNLDNKLVETIMSQVDVKAGEETTVTAGTKLEKLGTIKVFTWDGMTTMKPWAKSVVNGIRQ